MEPRPVEPGSPAAAVIAEEERLFARVQLHLATGAGDGHAAAAGAPLTDYDRELIELRDALAEAKLEDIAPLIEQMTRLQGIAARRGRSRTLPIDPDAPYFAHLKLREGARDRDVLIGKRGFLAKTAGGERIDIVDWRNAPVSRIYYRYDEGDDYDESAGGTRLEGVVLARRNLSIAGGRLRRIGTPGATYVRDARGVWHEAVGDARPVLQGGQGTAARPPRPEPVKDRKHNGKARLGVHGGAVPRGDKHLPEIAALIDREQFDLITRPASGLVLIAGGAGSGKTTVALHRVAYLAFADPQRFRPKKMLVVVPSYALKQYVAGVLPALGVPGVPVQTIRDWAASLRRRLVPHVGNAYAGDTPDAAARVKKHPAVLHLLDEVVAAQARAMGDELSVALAGADGAERILARWRETGERPLVPRLRKLAAWIDKQGDALPVATRTRAEAALARLRRRAGDVARDLEETLTDFGLLREALDRHGGAGATPRVTPRVTDDELRAAIRWVLRQKDVPLAEEYEGIDPERLEATDGKPVDDDAEGVPGRLDPEDDPLLLRLHQLKHGALIDREGHETQYDHVAIDEAQDLSAVQVNVLMTAAATLEAGGHSITIAGDAAQRLVFDNDFTGWDDLLRHAGHGPAEVTPLRLSYRSTAEVMRFARAVLGPLADPGEPLVARPGAPVELHPFADLGEAVAFLADALRALHGREPAASVAIICRHPEQADQIYAGLASAEVAALRRVRREDFSFSPGIDITDVTQVKGLEFDYVIALEVTASSYPDTLESRHLLHIAATRAAHQLWLVTTGDPSPLLPPGTVFT